MGDEDPGCGTGDGCFEILGKPSTAAEPGKGPFDHPATRQDDKASHLVGAPDDLEVPCAKPRQSLAQILTGIGAVSKEVESSFG